MSLFRRQAKVPKEKKFVFRVTAFSTWRVEIMRYVYVRHTEKHVTIIDTTGRECKHPWKSPTDEFFLAVEDAQARASERIEENKAKLAEYQKVVDESGRRIQNRKVVDMKPVDLKQLD